MKQDQAKKIVKIGGYLAALGTAVSLWFAGDKTNAIGVIAAALTGLQTQKVGE